MTWKRAVSVDWWGQKYDRGGFKKEWEEKKWRRYEQATLLAFF